jgi:hypothetical protein
MTPSGIEPVTFHFVDQCVNQLLHRMLMTIVKLSVIQLASGPEQRICYIVWATGQPNGRGSMPRRGKRRLPPQGAQTGSVAQAASYSMVIMNHSSGVKPPEREADPVTSI